MLGSIVSGAIGISQDYLKGVTFHNTKLSLPQCQHGPHMSEFYQNYTHYPAYSVMARPKKLSQSCRPLQCHDCDWGWAFRGTSSLGSRPCELEAEGSEEDVGGRKVLFLRRMGWMMSLRCTLCILKVVPGAN